MKRFPHLNMLVLLLVIPVLFCSSYKSQPSQYYMLSTSQGLSPVSSRGGNNTIGVGPVNLPDYLMRPEIVTRTSSSKVELGEFDRWAEPLDETMVRVLVENLSALLSDANLLGYPWNRSIPIDYRITVDVRTFEQHPDGNVHLVAIWNLLSGEGETVQTRRAELAIGVDGDGYAAIVSAMNAAMVRLSEEIASALSG